MVIEPENKEVKEVCKDMNQDVSINKRALTGSCVMNATKAKIRE